MNNLLVLVLSLVAIDAFKTLGPYEKRNNKFVLDSTNAADTDAPYQVSIISTSWFGDNHICGGALLNAHTVLTVAHCCEGKNDLKVKYGGTNRTNLAYTRTVSEVIMNSMYSSNTIDHDYCMLKLESDVISGKNVAFISVANSSAASGAKALLTGWGTSSQHLSNKPILPTKLQKANFNIVSSVDCNKKWSDINPVTKNMVCASSKTSSGCNGDSGGPLVVNGELVGLLSWGYIGCPTNTIPRPLVFADPTESGAREWIKNNA